MSQRNPNLSAAVYFVLISGVVLLCLIGALFTPASFSMPRWLGVGVLASLIVGIPILDRLAHRSRIREAVRELGGTTTRIRRLPFWKQEFFPWHVTPRFWVQHTVEYVDLTGGTHHALCRSGWFHGVKWLEDNVCNPEKIHAPF